MLKNYSFTVFKSEKLIQLTPPKLKKQAQENLSLKLNHLNH